MRLNISPVLQTPIPDLDNTVQYWGFFTPEEIRQATLAGTLLMIDMDAVGYTCALRCSGCFRRNHPTDDTRFPDLTDDERMRIVRESRALGVRVVKICGAGEPFESPGFLRFIRDVTDLGIGVSVFTKGHVLGDDQWVARVFGREGIATGEALCAWLFERPVSILLSVPSFNDALLGRIVGRPAAWYVPRLKRAAELLAGAGFNTPRPTRLAFVHAPMTKQSIDGAMEVYEFARTRNILPVLAHHMIGGLPKETLDAADPDSAAKLEVHLRAQEFNLLHGYQTMERLVQEWPSCMPGIQPCNQIAVGLWVTANGMVLRCAGDCTDPIGNVRTEPLSSIWKRHRTWEWTGATNVGCPFKDGTTIPSGMYKEILTRIKTRV